MNESDVVLSVLFITSNFGFTELQNDYSAEYTVTSQDK